ncbi:MAG: hypothetical protein GY755_15275 [Chloroflexi bacterium]|nr:hypothetical protein [Chloroflexota bacterium]
MFDAVVAQVICFLSSDGINKAANSMPIELFLEPIAGIGEQGWVKGGRLSMSSAFTFKGVEVSSWTMVMMEERPWLRYIWGRLNGFYSLNYYV